MGGGVSAKFELVPGGVHRQLNLMGGGVEKKVPPTPPYNY